MNYKFIIFIFLTFFIYGCEPSLNKKSNKLDFQLENRYKNSGFALIYSADLKDIKEIETRSLTIYHKTLKKKSMVKITNPANGLSLIAEVKSNKIKFSNFYNAILSPRIADTLELDLNEPYINIILISKDSTFVAKKAKTFDEETEVANKAPVDGIQINDLNLKKTEKKMKKDKIFSYSIKVADFYYKDTAKIMLNKIKDESSLKNLKILELSKTKYRLLIGPFNDIKSLKDTFEKMNLFNFENLEVLKNA